MADSILTIEATLPGYAPASLAADVLRDGSREALRRLANLMETLGSGVRSAKVRARVDSVTAYSARIALVLTQANIAAGEYIEIDVPGRGAFRFTAAASGADTANYGFNSATSNDATGASFALAVNSSPGTKDMVTATNASGTVTIVVNKPGSWGNAFVARDGTVNGVTGEGNFAGGLDASARVTSAITCVVANTDADDTIRIGKTTFTAKSSGASGESEFNLGATNTAMGDNLLAKIVAHSELAGLVSGSNASGVITLTWLCDPRVAVHVGYMVSSDADGLVLTAQPATNLTLAAQDGTDTFTAGG